MAKYWVDFFRVVRVVLRNYGMGLYELHVDAFRCEEALVFCYVPRQAEHRTVGLAHHFFQMRPPILIIFIDMPLNLITVYNRGRMVFQTRHKGKFLDSARCLA